MKKYLFSVLVCLFSVLLFQSCSKDDDSPNNGGDNSFIVNGEKQVYLESTANFYEYTKIKVDGEWVKVKGYSNFIIQRIGDEDGSAGDDYFELKSEWLDLSKLTKGYTLKEDSPECYYNQFMYSVLDFSCTKKSGTIKVENISDKSITLSFNNYTFERTVISDIALNDKTFVINGTVTFQIEANVRD